LEPRRAPAPWPEPRDAQRPRRSVLEGHAAAPARQVVGANVAGDVRLVHAGHLVPWMKQPVRQRAVVREEQRALDVGVETSDRVEPDVIRHEVRDDRSALWVADGRDVAAWLVDEDVVERFGTR